MKEVERIPSAGASGRFSPMNDLRLSEADSSFIFVILDDWQWGWDIRHGFPRGQGSALFYSPPYLRYLLDSRAPALPDWFVTGVTRLYKSIAFSDTVTGELSSAWTKPMAPSGNPWQDSAFESAAWTSRESAAALRAHPEAPRLLLPMQELFVDAAPAGRSAQYRNLWESQAELFVRWAFSDRIEDGRVRLQAFVGAAATEPVTEELFRTYLGMGYSDARDALSDYLPEAVSKRQPLAFAAAPADLRPVELREATSHEIHRIKGEWARRTLKVVRANFPAALPLYTAKARQLLQGSYDRGERDPQLIASLALYQIDSGDPKVGQRMLEDHPEAAEARPLAGVALAKLRLVEFLASPAGKAGSFSEEQAGKVLKELGAALVKQPPLDAAYQIAARVSLHLGRDPTDDERAQLNEGAQLFPRDSQLVMRCISWDLRANDLALARKLVDLGAYEASDPTTRDNFATLSGLVQSGSASGK